MSYAQGGRSVITPTESSRNVITTDTETESNSSIYQNDDDKPLWQRIQEEEEKQKRVEREKFVADSLEQVRLAQMTQEQKEQEKKKKAELERLEKERLAREKFVADSLEQIRIANEKAKLERQKKIQAEEKAKQQAEWVASIPKSNFFLLNGAYSTCPQYSFGLTYGHVKRLGWYANVMSNFGFTFSSDYESDANGCINGEYPFYSGSHKATYLSASVGAVVRLHIPVYLYGGVGYGYRSVFYELATGEWTSCKTETASSHGLHWEAGLLCNIKGFALSGGISSSTNFDASFFETKIGVGCFINKK